MVNDGIKRFDNEKIWKSFLFSVFCFLGLLLFSIQVKAEISESDIIFYFNADTGTNGLDEYFHENSINWRLTEEEYNGKTVSISTGKFGNAFYALDNTGTFQRDACLTNANIGTSTDSFAWSFWYKTNSTNSQGQAFTNRQNYYGGLGLRNNYPNSFNYTYYNSQWRDFGYDLYNNDNNWHHVVITGTYGNLTSTDAKIYIDGQVAESAWGDDYLPDYVYALTNFSIFGNYQGIESCHYAFQGGIDDLAYFNKVLTADEVDDLYNDSLADILNPPSNTFILAFGYPNIWSNPSVFPYNSTKTFPIFYNVCNVYNQLNKVLIQPKYSDGIWQPFYEVIKDKSTYIGPQKCSGNYFLKDNRASLDNGTVYFDLISLDSNNNVIASTSSNIITFEEETTPSTFIDSIYDKTLNIDLGNLDINPDFTSSTTRLYFNYDFHEKNYASTTVYLWDQILATSTGYTSSGPFSSTSSAIGFIDIPTPSKSTFKNYYFIANIPGYKSIKSDLFSVNWDFWPEEVYFECEEIEIDLSNICEGIPETTIGDWICEGKTALYKATNWALYPKCKDLIKLQIAFNKFKDSFPFNIYFDLNKSIKSSINNATSTENGISVPFIRKTATSSEFYMLPIAGTSSFSNLIGSENYNTYRTTLAFIYWLLVALLIYLQIRK